MTVRWAMLRAGRRRRGFTLLELVLASVLLALLMAGVVRITASLRPALQVRSDADALVPNALRIIERDAAHARFIRVSEGQLILRGFGGSEENSSTAGGSGVGRGGVGHFPADVTYNIQSSSAGPVLVRGEHRLDDARGRQSLELVGIGIEALEVMLLESVAASDEQVGARSTLTITADRIHRLDWVELTGSLRFALRTSGQRGEP
jgi:prepilin-type N-terminal cleavage/methylation domain-containing protein